MPKSSTRIEDLPDNDTDYTPPPSTSRQDDDDNSSVVSSIPDNDDNSFAFMSTPFMGKIINCSIESSIVFLLVAIFSNKQVLHKIFEIPFLTQFYNSIIGNSIVGFIAFIIFFCAKYLIDLI